MWWSVDRPGLGGGDQVEALDARGQDLVPELEEQTVARGQLRVDGAAAPGATVDGRGGGLEPLAAEPAARDLEQPAAQADETVEGVARFDDEAIAELQIRLADGPDLLDFAGPRGEGAGDNHLVSVMATDRPKDIRSAARRPSKNVLRPLFVPSGLAEFQQVLVHVLAAFLEARDRVVVARVLEQVRSLRQ